MHDSKYYGIFFAKISHPFRRERNLTNIFKISKDESKKRWFFKLFVFFVCLSCCLYQIGRYLELYFAYPTTLNIMIEHKAQMQPPGLTVCNSNRFRKSAFCKMFPERCYYYNTSTCPRSYDSNCHDENFVLLPNSEKEFETNCNKTLNILLGHFSYSLVKSVQLLPTDDTMIEIKKNYTMVPMSEGISCPRNCYLINSLLLDPYDDLPNISMNSEERKIMKVFLDLEPEEYLLSENPVEGLVQLHSPFVIENPYIHGFIVKPGNIYYVDVNMIEKYILPPPYDTNCQNYFKEWDREKSGPLSWEMCVQHCKMNRSASLCNCVPSRIMYPHKEKYCLEDDSECIQMADLMKCYSSCERSCYQRKFRYSVTHKKIPQDLIKVYEYIWDYQKEEMRKRGVIMIFTLREPEILVYRSSPKYQTIELYSYLGGYTGMWLGISFFTIYEFLESIMMRCYNRKKHKTILCMNKHDLHRKQTFLSR